MPIEKEESNDNAPAMHMGDNEGRLGENDTSQTSSNDTEKLHRIVLNPGPMIN